MALKADRQIDAVEIGYYLNETASGGEIVSVSTAASGADLDGITALATVSATISGIRPIGMLMNAFVDIDQTRYHRNFNKDQQVVGDKATIMTKGWAVTSFAIDATAGKKAYLETSGQIATIAGNFTDTDDLINPIVGTFRSGLDENGYARVYIDL